MSHAMEDNRITINIRDKRFPVEVRLKIFRHVVALQPGLRCPNLLLAVEKDPDLYAEACEAYRETNYVMTSRNQAEFKKFKVAEMLKIRHLTVIYRGTVDTPKPEWPSLRGNKMTWFNNLETITLDISGDNSVDGSVGRFDYQAIQRPESGWLARASLPGVSNLFMMFHVSQDIERAIRETQTFHFGALGEPRRWAAGEYGSDKKIIVWEAEAGKRLLSSAALAVTKGGILTKAKVH